MSRSGLPLEAASTGRVCTPTPWRRAFGPPARRDSFSFHARLPLRLGCAEAVSVRECDECQAEQDLDDP